MAAGKRLLKAVLPRWLIRGVRSIVAHRREKAAYQLKLRPYRRASAQGDSGDAQFCLAKLRMYAHVVDKGLQRHDWKSGHSKSAHRSGVRFLHRCQETDDPTYQWAESILERYGRGVAGECRTSGGAAIEEPAAPPITPDQLMRQLKFRTSTRCYVQREVSEEHARMIAEAALEAPSSCHRQTIKIYGSVNPEVTKIIGACFHGIVGFGDFLPMMLIFCADLRPYGYPAELFTPSIDTALAVENAVLMASSLGISMTLLNWVGRPESEEQLRACLDIAEHEAIVIGAVGGYPARPAARPIRKPVAKTLVLK